MSTTQKTDAVTLTLTARAAEEVKKFIAQEQVPVDHAGLRVAVMPGGCSGFQYALNIEERALDDDHTVESNGIRLFVDNFSAQYLNGVTIDFVTTMQSSGFTFQNPNASGGCGCGSSFTV